MNRRTFLNTSLRLTIGLALASPSKIFAGHAPSRTLSFFHTHTGEEFTITCENGRFSIDAQKKLFTFLRDFRTGDIHAMDLRLFSALAQIQDLSGSKGVYEVISGYRSPKTNELLRSQSNGVAKKSFHMKGRAIDVRLTDLKTRELVRVASHLQTGGVGYYPKSDFVHLDTGPVRSW